MHRPPFVRRPFGRNGQRASRSATMAPPPLASLNSSPPHGSSDENRNVMSEILVLVDYSEGAVSAFTAELLAAAFRLGKPAAVVVGKPGTADALASELGKLGAATVYSAESEQVGEFLLTPQVAGLQAAVQVSSPAAILLASSIDGREIAGRLAVRLNSGVITDAVDIGRSEDGAVLATQSVFGGSYTVQSTVDIGTP